MTRGGYSRGAGFPKFDVRENNAEARSFLLISFNNKARKTAAVSHVGSHHKHQLPTLALNAQATRKAGAGLALLALAPLGCTACLRLHPTGTLHVFIDEVGL